ncbi:MAG: hypothetical protein UZ19_OD1000742 [Parcubacteria bacterium OLB19]|nr:MAG: hypothetical protein UZ19_OD1000742 [Parcubacteria bacterium OLB19]
MKYFLKVRQKLGFTLVEILVYISIFVMVSAGAIGFLFSLDDLFVQYKLKQDLLASGTTIMERILLEVREANTLVLADSVIESASAGAITLDKGYETVEILKNGNNLELYRDNNFESVINSAEVEVLGSTFYRYEQNGVELIRVRLNLRSSEESQTEDWTITGGAIIRGSYETN